MPGNPVVRMALGILLIIGGFIGFLPILGFWMVPLGLLILSVDSAAVRRLRRRLDVWWGRRWAPAFREWRGRMRDKWDRWRRRWAADGET